MFSITLICMGKLKEKFYTEAAAEYAKRLKAYCAFQLIELPECRLPEEPSAAQIAQGLQKEAELIRAKRPKGCFFCVLTPEGRLLSSEQLADTTKIIVAQRISTIRHADQILVLDDGRLAGTGTHDELLAKDTIYQEIYHSQMKGGDADGEAIRR